MGHGGSFLTRARKLTLAGIIVAAVVGVACCLSGISILSSSDLRRQNIAEYNSAIVAYRQSGDIDAMQSWDSNGTLRQLHPSASPAPAMVLRQSTETPGVSGIPSTLVVATLTTWFTANSSIRWSLRGGALNIAQAVDLLRVLSVDIRCDQATNGIGATCHASQLQSQCQSRYGPTANYSGASQCSSYNSQEDFCGVCVYRASLSEACLVIKRNPDTNEWSLDGTRKSCYYPFTSESNLYKPLVPPFPTLEGGGSTEEHYSGVSIRLMLRSDTDPFLTLQLVTAGTNDFGVAKDRGKAVGLVVFGVLAVAAAVGVSLWLYNRYRMDQPTNPAANGSHTNRILHQNPPQLTEDQLQRAAQFDAAECHWQPVQPLPPPAVSYTSPLGYDPSEFPAVPAEILNSTSIDIETDASNPVSAEEACAEGEQARPQQRSDIRRLRDV